MFGERVLHRTPRAKKASPPDPVSTLPYIELVSHAPTLFLLRLSLQYAIHLFFLPMGVGEFV